MTKYYPSVFGYKPSFNSKKGDKNKMRWRSTIPGDWMTLQQEAVVVDMEEEEAVEPQLLLHNTR